MKTLLMLALLVVTGSAAADSATCYTIDDADARSYCLARANNDSSSCYAIANSGLKAQCLAEVRR